MTKEMNAEEMNAETAEQIRELTEEKTQIIAGGSHGGHPVRYMEFKLKEVFITSVH